MPDAAACVLKRVVTAGNTAARIIKIRGLPVYRGELLTPATPSFQSLQTLPDLIGFAKQLRGQFCILIESAAETFAITDFGYSRPVFYLRDPVQGTFRVGLSLAELAPLSSGRLNPAALYFHLSRGGIGLESFYSDITGLFPATVTRFHGAEMESARYLDWGELLETRPIAPHAAEESFVRIASEYLSAVLKGKDQVACLLS